MMLVFIVWTFVVAGAAAACTRPADQAATAADTPASPTVGVTRPAASTASVGAPARLSPTAQASPPSPAPLVALVTADAARRTGASPGDVRIVGIEAREWPDRSLGCPRPGMGYAQAITPGFLILAEAGGQRFEYHTDYSQVVLCAS